MTKNQFEKLAKKKDSNKNNGDEILKNKKTKSLKMIPYKNKQSK